MEQNFSVQPTIKPGILLISSIMLIFVLFFIDEGHYSLQWMMHPVNWVSFIIYAFPVFLGQILIDLILPSQFSGLWRYLTVILFGAGIGLLLVIKWIFGA